MEGKVKSCIYDHVAYCMYCNIFWLKLNQNLYPTVRELRPQIPYAPRRRMADLGSARTNVGGASERRALVPPARSPRGAARRRARLQHRADLAPAGRARAQGRPLGLASGPASCA